MFYDNSILIQLKKKFKKKTLRIEGIVKKSEKGFGFLETDSKNSYFIPPKKIKKVMHGDKIIAKIGFSKNREIVIPEKLIKSFLQVFIGRLQKINQQFFIVPNYIFLKEYIPCTFLIDQNSEFKSGDWFIAKLTKHKLNHDSFHANLIKFIAKKEDPFISWWITLSKYNLKKKEPKVDVKNISFFDSEKRLDLTNLSFITIDNSSTKDIDDALFIKKLGNNFKLIVAISDTTSFIHSKSKLDIIAAKRAFTNYLPGFNIPMLPRILSEDLCSLKPNQKRPVLACKMIISKTGKIQKNSEFFLAWIKSKEKLSYQNVSDWLEKKNSWIPSTKNIQKQLKLLKKLCISRIEWRKKYALIFPERLEYKFHLSSNGEVLKISNEKRRIAHKIVEECMISANITAANFLSKKIGFGLYNNHSGFDISDAKQISLLLKKNNIFITSKEILTLKGFRSLYKILKKNKYKYLNNRIRKFQSFSEFSLIPNPHYALGLKRYATWTSPIRKYGDIINHRFLKSIILGCQPEIINQNTIKKISDQKRKHRLSEKEIVELLYIQYFSKNNFKNKIFQSEIIDVLRGGIRAKLLDTGANVFIPNSFIHNIRSELELNLEDGLIYVKKKILHQISDIIQVKIIDIKKDTKSIIAKVIQN
ncbi:exoribonuclease II [Buchnera aphidicola]|uniref:exoribonuclease II n=1 Tax=Buchnera aphidicola TaxID=9 RepID=UPI002238E7C6|nr:exoribonuclease II [Buchnera aphidicola]MCW5197680.1 exoribonuclease II [Buchnera aphidicola (Chaitophorus viminalis)]